MMNKNDFKKLLSKIRGADHGLHAPKLMSPMRDWWIGLVVAGLIFSVAAVWSSYTYTKHRDMAVEEVVSTDTSAVVYREAMVKSALDHFAAKQAQHEALIQAAQNLNVKAPSLDAGDDAEATFETASTTASDVEESPSQEIWNDTETVNLSN